MNMTPNKAGSVLLLGNEKSVLADIKLQNTADLNMYLLSPGDFVLEDNTIQGDVAVVVADLMDLNELQQKRLLDLCEFHPFKTSEIVLIYDEETHTKLVPQIFTRATAIIASSKNTKQLLEIIENSKLQYRKKITLQNDLQNTLHAFKLLKKGVFKLKTLNEANTISILLATLCPSSTELALGLSELLVNGIEHGNLGISFEEKGDLIKKGLWQTEINKRLEYPENASKQVTIEFDCKTDTIEFLITDEGVGFDPEKYLRQKNGCEEKLNLTCFHGRGIKLAKQICFDHLNFLGVGNQVRAVINIRG